MLKKCLVIFLVSMVPLIELRGAVPIAFSPLFNVTLPIPLIYLFARKVLVWGKDKKFIGKFFTFCLNKGEKGGQKLQKKAGKGIYFALFLFVAIPVPGTGAWTGTLAASMLDLDFKKSMIAISLGVIAAGIIMGLGSAGLFTAIKHV